MTIHPRTATPRVFGPPLTQFSKGPESLVQVNRPGATEPLVNITTDGTVEYGDNYTPDEDARAFWASVAGALPGVLGDAIPEATPE